MRSTLPGSVLQFGECELDCGRFELRRNGHVLRVERKPLELLILLASREGQLVTREEIARHLWSNEVFVDTEHGINTAVRKLRYGLRDDPEHPQYILTVPGMGYRLIAPVSAIGAIEPAEVAAEAAPTDAVPVAPATPSRSRRISWGWYALAGACLVVGWCGVVLYRMPHRRPEVRYTRLTDFTDSAVAPAVSPDGRMVAFIRGGNAFLSSDQIYVKMVPNGEARRVTDDARPKYGLAFSPNGTEIAYTVLESTGFSTYEVSSLGGEPHLLLNNAAGLVWLDSERLLFSQIQTGIHLGVVTATVTRAGLRDIYFPAHERGMAHYAFPSPDRHWALVVEMNGNGFWGRCRLVDLESQSAAKLTGPAGGCTSAGWSPDGKWMYFTATVGGQSHLWRQHFPGGEAEQLTFGPTEEDGVAVEPQGRALITSLGVHESAVWLHDPSGERPLSSEGEVMEYFVAPPVFSPDATALYYLLRHGADSGAELWRTVVESRQSEAVFPGISMSAFDLSPDGKQVVYTTAAADGTSQLWVASLDGSVPATRVSNSAIRSPHFGARGEILFLETEENKNYLEQINADGSHAMRVLPYPIEEFQSISPGRRWVIASVPETREKFAPITAIPLEGGTARRICAGFCFPSWSTDGKFLFVPVEDSSRTSPGRSLAIPLGPGESFPVLPAGGIAPMAEAKVVRGAESVGRAQLVPGRDPKHYAWVNTTVHGNLYEVSLP